MEKEFKAIYGQAMSIVTHKPSQYAKNITLRYPMKSTFKGDKVRICLDNFTGKEGVVFDSVTIGRVISGRDWIQHPLLILLLMVQKDFILMWENNVIVTHWILRCMNKKPLR